jgi:2-dehydropantoate 2-reductase
VRIAIIGPGAMGCLFAAGLARARHEVWLLDHDTIRAAAIRRRGVRVTRGGRTRLVRVPVTTNPSEIPSPDLLMVCVKSHDTARALRTARPLLATSARVPTVLTLQNGLGNAEVLARFVPPDRVLAGATAHGATLLAPGRVRHGGVGSTVIAPMATGSWKAAARARTVVAALSQAGFETRVAGDWRSVVWGKVALNAAINPLTALYGVRNGALVKRPDLRALAGRIATEAAAVAAAERIPLAYSDPVAEVAQLCRATAANRSSMWQDVHHGRRTEIADIAGRIVAAGRRRGVPTPETARMLRAVKRLEQERRAT